MNKPGYLNPANENYSFTRRFSNGEPVIEKVEIIDSYHAGLYLSAFYYDILPARLKLLLKDIMPESGTRNNVDSHRTETTYVLLLEILLEKLIAAECLDTELLAEIRDEIADVTTSHVPVENLVGENSGLIALAMTDDTDDIPVIVVGGTDMLHLVPQGVPLTELDSFDADAVTNPMIGAVRTVVTEPDPNATDPGFDGEGFYLQATAHNLLPPSDLTVEGNLSAPFVLAPDADTYTGEAPVEEPPVTEPGFVPPEGWADENYGVVDLYDSSIMVQGPQPDDTPFPGQGKK